MRTIVLAMVAAMATAPVMAADLGNGLELNTEAKAFHKVDATTNHVTMGRSTNHSLRNKSRFRR
jgi:dihydrofolate reductase